MENKCSKKIVLLVIIFITGCDNYIFKDPYCNNPLDVFDAIWDEYDKTYGAFEVKRINWDSCRKIYRPKLTINSTNDQLYNVLCSLLLELNDGHVQLIANGYKRFYSKPLPTLYPDSRSYENATEINALYQLIRTRYLYFYKDTFGILYGRVSLIQSSTKVGYLYIASFENSTYNPEFLDEALKNFESCKALIIDIRFNGGGASHILDKYLQYFSDNRRLYLKSKIRNGPNHDNFSSILMHYMQPANNAYKENPIMVLVNRHTASSAEHFVLAMRARQNTLIIGDTTYGALSIVIPKLAPNGWEFRTCPQVLLDTSGQYLCNADGKYPDGIGLPPDIRVINNLHEIYSGTDKVLSTAIQILENKFLEE